MTLTPATGRHGNARQARRVIARAGSLAALGLLAGVLTIAVDAAAAEPVETAQDERTATGAPPAGATAAQERISVLEAELAQAQEALALAQARRAELEAQIAVLQEAAAARDALNERLERLRARLPAPEGGSLTVDQARRRAGEDAAELVALVEGARGIDNPHLWAEVRSAENALHRSQFLLARADNARTVYRVRPGDSLRQVSQLFYGNIERWTALFEANRHVLDDPNRLLPGLTLVVP